MLCDQSWIDPDLDDTNGIQVREQRDMLRLESQILLVQLHIRKSLTVSSSPLPQSEILSWGVSTCPFLREHILESLMSCGEGFPRFQSTQPDLGAIRAVIV